MAASDVEATDLLAGPRRSRGAVRRERITKRFYEQFSAEQAAFQGSIRGIDRPAETRGADHRQDGQETGTRADDGSAGRLEVGGEPDPRPAHAVREAGDREWYAALMLNRLMFVYFLQAKGFLAGDTRYLRNRLAGARGRAECGARRSFYRGILLALFHQGFGKRPERRELDPEMAELLGDVPYLNGGMFEVHELERTYPDIDIPDAAFERLFSFLDQYEWRLDKGTLLSDREITPDVLGDILEQLVNRKQMGAYYTGEDITGYIASNTIIPWLFDAAKKRCPSAFEPGSGVWRLLRDDPERYIYPAMRHGALGRAGQLIPLPAEIFAGMDDVRRRGEWNRPAMPEYGLPGETWCQYVARRERSIAVREQLRAAGVHDINDLITLNLDIGQFAVDVILSCEQPELLRAFYEGIAGRVPERPGAECEPGIKILDPTCGSGAFLFAALRVLWPLYEACLDRMQAFVQDAELSVGGRSTEAVDDFARILAEAATHPDREYFVLKSIVAGNLYGVDVMEEAIEICKLRLFLALVAHVRRVEELEPLPDIGFNLRVGNALVGYTSLEAKAAAARDARESPRALSAELDRYLAAEYGVDSADAPAYQHWQETHQPFHWCVEFGEIMGGAGSGGGARDESGGGGGFDVVIGNPPYVEASDIRGRYDVRGLRLKRTGNLFAWCTERFLDLTGEGGRLGVILPLSAICTPRMEPLARLLIESTRLLHASHYAVRPGKLFVGVDMNLSVLLGSRAWRSSEDAEAIIHSTRYLRWNGGSRPFLFQTLRYAAGLWHQAAQSMPKIGSDLERRLLQRIARLPTLKSWLAERTPHDVVYYHSGGRYFRKCLRKKLSNEYKELRVRPGAGGATICLLSSSLYYWLWIALSDCYHMTARDIAYAPVSDEMLNEPRLSRLSAALLDDLWANATRRSRHRADGRVQEEVNFNVARSRPILDEIDGILGDLLEISEEERDFLLSYDAGFRTADGLT